LSLCHSSVQLLHIIPRAAITKVSVYVGMPLNTIQTPKAALFTLKRISQRQ